MRRLNKTEKAFSLKGCAITDKGYRLMTSVHVIILALLLNHCLKTV